ncbi:hypothetical protein [Janthinobacterium sp. NKUCC08_JDC]|uniref:hypothetical protein n=1 Tax=Janthinobacterium sp. NKUCC08_JDC TaxID=2842122 RepID=UPI001C5AE455|nr:hypothetical protein [Janthinobacterium sp. NKUCC08_JDC]MBW3500057.1 hypothetical protein [Janthinobacterium sp. NKUCC08_JDC]
MSKVAKIAVGLAVTIICVNSFAAQGRWTEGFGQGNLEYFIDQDGMRLYIGCPTQDGSAESQSSVSLSQLNNNKEVEKFTVDVNGVSYDGPFSADSRAGDNNFISLLENLRKGNAVVKFNGKAIKIPKSNAAKIIPVYGKKFSCNLSM